MKKSVLFLVVFSSLLLAACGNQSSGGTAAPSASASANPDAVDLVVGANYYEVVKDDQGNSSYKYGTWLPAGSVVTLLSTDVKTVKVPDSKGNLIDDMISQARLPDGKEVFISRYYILPRQRAGVIIAADKAMIYNGLKPANVTTNSLPRLTLVGVPPVDEKDNPLKRQQFTAYRVPQANGNPVSSGVWGPLYIDAADVSTAVNDVEMAKAIAGLASKDKSLWGKIISDTDRLNPNSVFLADARAMIGQAENEIAAAAPKATEAVSLAGTVNDDDVNVRTTPDEMKGDVIGRLSSGASVTISAQTSETYTVAGATARWYKIKSGGLEGWVFGSFLVVQ
jgi:hypothetical protein